MVKFLNINIQYIVIAKWFAFPKKSEQANTQNNAKS